jgi:predicted nicotinamide N-methyase
MAAAEERCVSAPELARFCAALVASPARVSVAASTSARPPASVRVRFAVAAPLSPQLQVCVRELEYCDGGLGFRLFPAALWLSAWLATRPQLLRGATLLELGAGLGLVGLTAACTGLCARVWLTDFNPGLLRALAAAAAANDVRGGSCCVAHCDWAEEAAAASSSAIDAPPGAFERDANPEFFRIRAQLEASAGTGTSATDADAAAAAAVFPRLPRGETFSLVVATEVLYEMFAAVTLPGVVAARLARRGRFVTLMAVRDADLLAEFLARLQRAGLRVALRGLADVALPPADAAQAAAQAAAHAAAMHASEDAPLCGGEWAVGAAGWQALLRSGGAGGGALEAAWVEAQRPGSDDSDGDAAVALAQQQAQPRPPCCSRAARGMACPCARGARPGVARAPQS